MLGYFLFLWMIESLLVLGYFLFLWMRESLLISYCFLRDRNPTCIYIGHFVFSFDTEKRRIFSSPIN